MYAMVWFVFAVVFVLCSLVLFVCATAGVIVALCLRGKPCSVLRACVFAICGCPLLLLYIYMLDSVFVLYVLVCFLSLSLCWFFVVVIM